MSLFYLEHPAETDLALFAGGELGPLARWRIEKHVQNCERCRDTVADFFHLQGDLAELAELPSMDWDALAQTISERVGRENPEQERPSPGFFARPTVLRVGFATATVFCALVVVRQLQFEKTAEPDLKPLVAAQLSPTETKAAVGEGAAESDDAVAAGQAEGASSQVGFEARPTDDRQVLETELAGAASGDQPGRNREIGAVGASRSEEALPTDMPRPSTPPSPRKTDLAAGLRALSFADENEAFRAGQDRASSAAGPQAEPEARKEEVAASVRRSGAAPQPQVQAQREGDESARGAYEEALRDRVDEIGPLAERAEKAGNRRGNLALRGQVEQAQARRQVAAVTRTAEAVGRQVRLEQEGPAYASEGSQLGFGIQPAALEDPQADIGVAADGWMSVRSVDSKTGTITITHVYVP